MREFEFLEAKGHRDIRATHPTTFQVTKDPVVTSRGDCIIGVKATKGASDLSDRFKQLSRSKEAKIAVTLKIDGLETSAFGYGHPKLQHTHPQDLVFRKSRFLSNRTVMIMSNLAACDIPREIVRLLADPRTKVEVALKVEVCVC